MQDSKESPVVSEAKVVDTKETTADAPKKTGKKPIVIVLIVLGVLLVLCVICGVVISIFTNKAANTLNNLLTPTVTSAPGDTDTPSSTIINPTNTTSDSAKIGEWVTVSNFKWKVTSAKNLGKTLESTNQFIDSKTTSGNWIQVKFDVQNIGTDADYIDVPQVVDANGVKFDYSSDAFFFIPSEESPVLEKLNPGISGSYTAIYEVSSPISGLKLLVGTGLFETAQSVDLGL